MGVCQTSVFLFFFRKTLSSMLEHVDASIIPNQAMGEQLPHPASSFVCEQRVSRIGKSESGAFWAEGPAPFNIAMQH